MSRKRNGGNSGVERFPQDVIFCSVRHLEIKTVLYQYALTFLLSINLRPNYENWRLHHQLNLEDYIDCVYTRLSLLRL
jgi:hypothetical protein